MFSRQGLILYFEPNILDDLKTVDPRKFSFLCLQGSCHYTVMQG